MNFRVICGFVVLLSGSISTQRIYVLWSLLFTPEECLFFSVAIVNELTILEATLARNYN